MQDRLPQLPLFVDDFEAATAHLTLEEDGAYNRLLRLCWRTPGCSIPDDDAWIKRRMRCDQSTYDCVVRPIIEEFFTRKGGRIFQRRLSREYEYVTETRKRRQEAGAKGGKAKRLNNNDTDPGRDKAGLKHPTPPHPTREEKGETRENAAREMSFLDRAVDALGPAASPISTGFNMVQLNQWREHGCSEAHIIEWLRNRGKRMKPHSVGSFAYFKSGPVDALSDPPKQQRREKTAGEKLEALRRREAAKRAIGAGT